jgi:hypothetical protein
MHLEFRGLLADAASFLPPVVRGVVWLALPAARSRREDDGVSDRSGRQHLFDERTPAPGVLLAVRCFVSNGFYSIDFHSG